MDDHFELQFDPSRIKEFAGAYSYKSPEEANILDAGKRISAGDFRRQDFDAIVEWKSQRVRSRFHENSDADIFEAMQLAISSQSDRAAIAVLVGLHGVQVPVASALMSVVKPDKYTIIDFRALEALGAEQPNPTIQYYLSYLSKCRELAAANAVDLRTLDRALWQWSKQNGTMKSN